MRVNIRCSVGAAEVVECEQRPHCAAYIIFISRKPPNGLCPICLMFFYNRNLRNSAQRPRPQQSCRVRFGGRPLFSIIKAERARSQICSANLHSQRPQILPLKCVCLRPGARPSICLTDAAELNPSADLIS